MLIATMNSVRRMLISQNHPADCHDTCIRDEKIEYYWQTEDMQDDDEGIHVATLTGTLAITREMDDDPRVVCDDEDQDLGYVMSSAYEAFMDDLFYIREFRIDPKVKFPLKDKQNPDDRIEKDQLLPSVIKSLADTVLYTMGTRPQILVTYPAPLPYEEDEAVKKHREKAQRILANRIQVNMDRMQEEHPENHIIISLDEEGSVTEDDVNYMMGSGGGYPERAINWKEFDMWEAVGFEEIDDTRVMIYFPEDPMDEYDDDDEDNNVEYYGEGHADEYEDPDYERSMEEYLRRLMAEGQDHGNPVVPDDPDLPF